MSGTYYRSSRVISKNNARNYLSSNVKIPAPIEYIASEAFQKKTKISSVCFPDTLKNIGARTFQCNSLKKVILPQALSSIPRAAFQENRKLGCVIFPHDSQISRIRSEAFSQCTSLESLQLSSALTLIEDRAFYRCKNLRSVDFPEGLKRIGKEAFYFCAIEELHLPQSLEFLDESAFFKCMNLTYVCLPTNIHYIGKWVFHGCNRMKYLEIRHDPDFIGPWIINRACTIRCYKGSKVDEYCKEFDFKVEYL